MCFFMGIAPLTCWKAAIARAVASRTARLKEGPPFRKAMCYSVQAQRMKRYVKLVSCGLCCAPSVIYTCYLVDLLYHFSGLEYFMKSQNGRKGSLAFGSI